MDYSKYKSLYDVEKRGSAAPEYSEAELAYRSKILTLLQTSYQTREMPHQELNDKTYSEYYLTNRQQDMAYNPPKKNISDSRLVTGTTHEKDNTVQQLVVDMNLMPQVEAYDSEDPEMKDYATFMTALIKKSLKKEGFKKKSQDYIRINVSQGNVFILEQLTKKYETKKIPTNTTEDPFKQKFVTVTEKSDEYCDSMALPNTAVFLPNLLEEDIQKQPYIHVVIHMPTVTLAQMFKDFPRWKNVPKSPTITVPANTDGIYGDYFLQQPTNNYSEVIIYEDKPNNEYQFFINGVMMYPITVENNVVLGFPLTYFSPSGEYDVVKGNNERIPFFAYSKGIPTKNEVKEEVANEFLRIATHKFRYSAFPSVGNNSDKVMPSNIWDPSVVIPDLKADDLSVLNPNGALTGADFSFYNLIMNSMDESSVSKSVEGTNNATITATQYVDQKKENLKKLGITIDGTVELFRDFYWLRLYNEMFYLDKKKKRYSKEKQKMMEMYEDFMSEETIGGEKQAVAFTMVDEMPETTPEEMLQNEIRNPKSPRSVYVNPKKAKEMFLKIKDKFYMNVVSEPEGQNQSLLGILMNLLTAYQGLRGGTIPNLNWDYMDKLIDENSGFQSNKLFTQIPVNQMPSLMASTGMEGGDVYGGRNLGTPSAPKAPSNSLLANAK